MLPIGNTFLRTLSKDFFKQSTMQYIKILWNFSVIDFLGKHKIYIISFRSGLWLCSFGVLLTFLSNKNENFWVITSFFIPYIAIIVEAYEFPMLSGHIHQAMENFYSLNYNCISCIFRRLHVRLIAFLRLTDFIVFNDQVEKLRKLWTHQHHLI